MPAIILGGLASIIGIVIFLFAPSGKASGGIIFAVGIGALARGWQQMKSKQKK